MALVPLWVASVVLTATIELGVDLVYAYFPVCYFGLLAGSLCLGVFVVPQQCCLRIHSGVLVALFVALLLHLQYTTAVAFGALPRAMAILMYGLPNLLVCTYIFCVLVLYVSFGILSTAEVRMQCWRLYTAYAPMLLVPQTLLVLTACLTSSVSQTCIHHCFVP